MVKINKDGKTKAVTKSVKKNMLLEFVGILAHRLSPLLLVGLVGFTMLQLAPASVVISIGSLSTAGVCILAFLGGMLTMALGRAVFRRNPSSNFGERKGGNLCFWMVSDVMLGFNGDRVLLSKVQIVEKRTPRKEISGFNFEDRIQMDREGGG